MLLRELLFEGYKEAIVAFSGVASVDEVNQVISQYKELVNRNQVQGNERNIDWWVKQGWDKFRDFVATKINVPSKTAIKTKKVVGKSINLVDNERWLIVIPLDKNASCFHGKDSDWCTTKINASHFETYFYKKDITLIYCLEKNTGNMWAIASHPKVDQIEIFNKQDVAITPKTFTVETGMDAYVLANMANTNHGKDLSKARSSYKDVLAQLSNAFENVITDRNADIEKMLLYTKDGYYTYQYVDKLIENNVDINDLPEALKRVLFNVYVQYLDKFDQSRISEGTMVEVATNSFQALSYINNPSEKVIDAALSNHGYGIRYLTHKYPESKILEWVHKYPKAASIYAMDKNIRIPEMESAIAKDPSAINSYLKVYHKKWPEAEATILKNMDAIPKYVATNMKGERWPEAEKVLLQRGSADYMYLYAKAIGERFIEAEPKIQQDVDLAASYAVDVMHHPWYDIEDELEEMNPKESESAVAYANTFDWKRYKEIWSDYFDDEPDYYNDDYY